MLSNLLKTFFAISEPQIPTVIGLSVGQGVMHGAFLGVGMGVVMYVIVGVV